VSRGKKAEALQLAGSMMLRAHVSSEEWQRLRLLALARNESTPQMIGGILRAFLSDHDRELPGKVRGA
jgi:hypothetical protein